MKKFMLIAAIVLTASGITFPAYKLHTTGKLELSDTSSILLKIDDKTTLVMFDRTLNCIKGQTLEQPWDAARASWHTPEGQITCDLKLISRDLIEITSL